MHPLLRPKHRNALGVAAGAFCGLILAVVLAAPYFALADRAGGCRGQTVAIGNAMLVAGCDSTHRCGAKVHCDRFGAGR